MHFNILEELLEGCRAEGLDVDAADGDRERGTGTSGEALEARDFLSGGLGLAALDVVIAAASEEVVTGGGLLEVLNADVDLLLNNASVHALVEQNSDGAGSDVPDDTSLSVVVLVGHTLVNLTAGLHINDISNTERVQVGGQGGVSVLTIGDGESVAGACAITVRVRHLNHQNKQTKTTYCQKRGTAKLIASPHGHNTAGTSGRPRLVQLLKNPAQNTSSVAATTNH